MDGRLARKSGVGAALLAAALLTAASSAGTRLFLTVVIGCGSSCSLTSVARALLPRPHNEGQHSKKWKKQKLLQRQSF